MTLAHAEDLPPATLLVWYVLDRADEDELPRRILQDRALLADNPDAFEAALRRLRDHGLIATRPDPDDGRRVLISAMRRVTDGA